MTIPASTPIIVAYGDGESPTIIEAALYILREAGAPITLETIEIGSRIYAMQHLLGILPSSLKTLEKNRILLKGRTAQLEDPGYRDVGKVIKETFQLEASHATRLTLAEHSAIAHINAHFAMFEPEEYSLPSAVLACIMMLNHIGSNAVAQNLANALEITLAEGVPAPTLKDRWLAPKISPVMRFAHVLSTKLTAAYSKTDS